MKKFPQNNLYCFETESIHWKIKVSISQKFLNFRFRGKKKLKRIINNKYKMIVSCIYMWKRVVDLFLLRGKSKIVKREIRRKVAKKKSWKEKKREMEFKMRKKWEGMIKWNKGTKKERETEREKRRRDGDYEQGPRPLNRFAWCSLSGH